MMVLLGDMLVKTYQPMLLLHYLVAQGNKRHE